MNGVFRKGAGKMALDTYQGQEELVRGCPRGDGQGNLPDYRCGETFVSEEQHNKVGISAANRGSGSVGVRFPGLTCTGNEMFSSAHGMCVCEWEPRGDLGCAQWVVSVIGCYWEGCGIKCVVWRVSAWESSMNIGF